VAMLVAHNDTVATYDLQSLGWHSFQQLCLTISREVLGQTVQTFLNSKDGGRDGAFAGKWTPQAGENLSGKFVIQCKSTSKLEKPLKLSDVADELEKVRRLVEKKRCDCYLLLTNYNISGIQEEKIEDAFRAVGVKQFRCFGADWISQQIRERKRLRMLVPRVYGLGDLSQILDGRAYSQARALLDSMREDLSKVVLTGVYGRAVRALEAHGFVLLLGEPASGKTTIAAMLAMAAIDQWRVSTLKLETSQQMIDRWNPEDPFQFFWIDDAFGVTQFELPLALDWNRIFPKVKAMINAGARVVLTSRDYIYKRAKQSLKESAFPLMRESQVVIDVHDITAEERRQILYNHIKLGNQPREFRSAVKFHLDHVASHPRFAPETARRLGNPLFTRDLQISRPSLTDFVERQEQLLQEVIEGLDRHSQAALALIFMRNGALESPIKLRASEESALVRLGTDLGETIAALGAMQNSLTVYVKEEGLALWSLKHEA
jgi:energy-coupling factor transporter ATP-binding protein EcfA2